MRNRSYQRSYAPASRALVNRATCENHQLDIPIMSNWTCTTEPEVCSHCLAFLIHLGCDISSEIGPIQGMA